MQKIQRKQKIKNPLEWLKKALASKIALIMQIIV